MMKRIIIISGIVASILAIGAGIWYYKQSGADETGSDTVEVTPAPTRLNKDDADEKKDLIEKDSKNDTTSTTPTAQETKKVEIDAKQQGSNVVVTTKLYTVGDGNCTLVMKNGAKQVTKTAPVIYQPSYSTCAGFSTSVSELGKGTWTINLTATSRKSVTASTSQTLEVQ